MSVSNQNQNITTDGMILCSACGKEIHSSASVCPHCGAQRRTSRYKSKTIAALFAFFLGAFGGHRFYLGQWWGIFYLLFFWLWIPSLISLGEFIYFLVCNEKKWDEKYNEGIPAGPNDKSSGALVAVLVLFGTLFFISILGILAAIAIPAYHDYTTRVKLAESHTSAQVLMLGVETYYSEKEQWPVDINDIETSVNIESEQVESVRVDNGIIYITPSSSLNVEGAIIYVPSETAAGIEWSCKESTVESKYLPQKCRE